MEQKQLSEYSTIELKSLAYDQIQNIEVANMNLKAINQELNKRVSEVKKED